MAQVQQRQSTITQTNIKIKTLTAKIQSYRGGIVSYHAVTGILRLLAYNFAHSGRVCLDRFCLFLMCFCLLPPYALNVEAFIREVAMALIRQRRRDATRRRRRKRRRIGRNARQCPPNNQDLFRFKYNR